MGKRLNNSDTSFCTPKAIIETPRVIHTQINLNSSAELLKNPPNTPFSSIIKVILWLLIILGVRESHGYIWHSNSILCGVLSYSLYEISCHAMIKSTSLSFSFLPVGSEIETKSQKGEWTIKVAETWRHTITPTSNTWDMATLSNTESVFKILILLHNFQISEQRKTHFSTIS